MGGFTSNRNPIGVDPEQTEIVTRDGEKIVVDQHGNELIVTTGHSEKRIHDPDIEAAKNEVILPDCYDRMTRKTTYVYRRKSRIHLSGKECQWCSGTSTGPNSGNENRLCEKLKELDWDEFAERSEHISSESSSPDVKASSDSTGERPLVSDGGTSDERGHQPDDP